jgi:hypothetical protein
MWKQLGYLFSLAMLALPIKKKVKDHFTFSSAMNMMFFLTDVLCWGGGGLEQICLVVSVNKKFSLLFHYMF